MICETVVGRLEDLDIEGKTVEYVPIEWHEAFKKFTEKRQKAEEKWGSVWMIPFFPGDCMKGM